MPKVAAIPSDLGPGDVLGGRYRLMRLLGEGGAGVVWAAKHLTTDQEVAIKVLKGKDSAHAARFLREARVAAKLSHRNIVQIFDFWDSEADGPVFMVMELLSGETLARRLERQGRLSLPDTLSTLLAVASAMRVAHAQGIVHRDLKPANIFLSAGAEGEAAEVRVLDFGLARPAEGDGLSTAITKTGAVVGTPYYMAPEQMYGEEDIDVRADVWALGVIVYECLTGERPFAGDNLGQVFRRVNAGTFRPLRDLVPDVPSPLDALVRRMLSHERELRPDMADACEGLANPHAPLKKDLPQSTLRMSPAAPSTVRMASAAPSTTPSTVRMSPARPSTVRMSSAPPARATGDAPDVPPAPEERGPASRSFRRRIGLWVASGALGALVCVTVGALLASRFRPQEPAAARATTAPTQPAAVVVAPLPPPLPSTNADPRAPESLVEAGPSPTETAAPSAATTTKRPPSVIHPEPPASAGAAPTGSKDPLARGRF